MSWTSGIVKKKRQQWSGASVKRKTFLQTHTFIIHQDCKGLQDQIDATIITFDPPPKKSCQRSPKTKQTKSQNLTCVKRVTNIKTKGLQGNQQKSHIQSSTWFAHCYYCDWEQWVNQMDDWMQLFSNSSCSRIFWDVKSDNQDKRAKKEWKKFALNHQFGSPIATTAIGSNGQTKWRIQCNFPKPLQAMIMIPW